MIKASKVVLAIIWSIVLVVVFSEVATKTKALSDQHYRLLEPPPFTEFRTELIDMVTLGFRPAFDDMVAIWVMQFLFDKKINDYSPEIIHKTILQSTRLHPKSPGLYMSACFYLALNRSRPDLCESIMLDGMKALPKEWRLPATQGFMEAYKLKNISKAVVYYSIAVSRPDHPEFMPAAIASLKELGEIDTNTLNATLQSIAGDGMDSNIAEFIKRVVEDRPAPGKTEATPPSEEDAP